MLEAKEVLLRCSNCQSERPFSVNLSQFRQLAEGRPLQFHCSYCSCPQFWEMAKPVDPAELENSQPERPKNILVVDDDDLTLKLLRKVLEAWEAHIESAENGKDALAKLASGNFDLMVCDIQMPGMNGRELFQHIQENALLPAQRIIFLTGDKSAATREFLDGSGCYYVYKPLQFLNFSEQIQAILAGESMPDSH